MKPPIYIFDPTAHDKHSAIRGVGRYIQTLRESLTSQSIFTQDIHTIPAHAIVINPFYSPLFPEQHTIRHGSHTIAVIHDLIPLKYTHHFPTGIRRSFLRMLKQHTIHQYRTIVTVSHASKRDIQLLLRVPEKNIHVIYPPVAQTLITENTTSQEDTSLTLPPPQQYCVYVGDITWNKNLVNLFTAIQKAQIPCVFVGKNIAQEPKEKDPWQKEFTLFKQKAINSPYAQYTGYVSDTTLRTIYRNALCNILVSRDEGFGFSYVEAASLGTPSVLADIPVLRETAKDTALFAHPEDPHNIAQAIETLKRNSKLRNEIAIKAQHRSQDFNTKAFGTQWQKLIDMISL